MGADEELINKGGLAELVLGWELVKYASPRVIHDLYYWEKLSAGTSSEVDYITARNLHVLPIECKAGMSGKMKSLRHLMRNKNLTNAICCSLYNFSKTEFCDNDIRLQIQIIPLYAISNV